MSNTTISTATSASAGPTRRGVLGLAAGAAAVLGAGGARAADGMDHSQMDHSQMDHSAMGHDMAGHAMGPKNAKLVAAALACEKTGTACMEHCIDLMGSGDTSLKDCMRSVSVMLPTIQALARHAAFDSKFLKAVATLCRAVCEDCEAECKKHEAKHALCKACREACTECAEACKAIAT